MYVNDAIVQSEPLVERTEDGRPFVTLETASIVLTRQRHAIAAVTAVFVLLAVVYLYVTPRLYTATASILIDSPRSQSSGLFEQAAGGEGQVDSAEIETQSELAKSEGVIKRAIRQLGLVGDGDKDASIITRWLAAVGEAWGFNLPSRHRSPEDEEFYAILQRLVAKRVGLTHIINISFTFNNPTRAALIANGISDAYVAEAQRLRSVEARLITPASVPVFKTSPSMLFTLIGALVLGAAAGIVVAIGRELADRTYRYPDQIQSYLQTRFLGGLPLHKDTGIGASRILQFVTDEPSSLFTEVVRNILVSSNLELSNRMGGCRVIEVVSASHGEGRTTVCHNLSRLSALAGNPTLLINGDLRSEKLPQDKSKDAGPGLEGVLLGESTIGAAVRKDPKSGLHVLQTASTGVYKSREISSPERFKKLITSARESYAFVFVDLPPLSPFVEAKALGKVIDGFVLVVQSGHTSRRDVRDALRFAELSRDRLIGAVLNKV